MRTFYVTPESPEQAFKLLKASHQKRTSASGGMLWDHNWKDHNTLAKWLKWWNGYLTQTRQHTMGLNVTHDGKCDSAWMTFTTKAPNNTMAEAFKVFVKRDKYGRFAK